MSPEEIERIVALNVHNFGTAYGRYSHKYAYWNAILKVISEHASD